ncbi:MAG: hypothetical protein FJZ00_12920, partial [Candidatus Sericytochromatia bacterium]|nr:hypothetical protein [Candidatus Tanganyikabacteria bacterium]
MSPALIFSLGPEGAAILARVKSLWEKFPQSGSLLAICARPPEGLDDSLVAALEREGQGLPKAAIATALASLPDSPDAYVVCDLTDVERSFLQPLAAEIRKTLGDDRRIIGVFLLPAADASSLDRAGAGDVLSHLWPVPGIAPHFDRLFLAEAFTETGATWNREALYDAVALRLAIEGAALPPGAALRERSDSLDGTVRSLGGTALRYPCRAVAELAAARLGAALVEGWCGSPRAIHEELPNDLPVDEDALEYAALTPDAGVELEAFFDELLWGLRGRYPQLNSLVAALPAELDALETAQFGTRQPAKFGAPRTEESEPGEHAVFIRETRSRSVLESVRERMHRQVVTWRSRIEAELAG